jgi:hypothetical protein
MISSRQRRALGAFVSIAIVGGCTTLPTYRWVDAETAVRTLRERSAQIKTLSGPCELALTNERGDTVRFEAALAARLPDHVRLRAWKLGQVALDLTVTPQGFWVMTGRDSGAGSDLLESLQAGRLMEAWSVATGRLFDRPDLVVGEAAGKEFTVAWPVAMEDGDLSIRCVIERPTLTPHLYVVEDPAGTIRSELILDRYRSFDGIVWPTRIAGLSEHGSFVLEMTEPEFNEALAPAAFTPPAGAVRRSP